MRFLLKSSIGDEGGLKSWLEKEHYLILLSWILQKETLRALGLHTSQNTQGKSHKLFFLAAQLSMKTRESSEIKLYTKRSFLKKGEGAINEQRSVNLSHVPCAEANGLEFLVLESQYQSQLCMACPTMEQIAIDFFPQNLPLYWVQFLH